VTKTASTLIASLVVLSIGSAGMTAPAAAGGSVSISVAPSNAKLEKAMRTGLSLYALYNGIRNGGIRQKGSNNSAGLLQNGSGNLGIVHQQGDGHDGTLQQDGNGNSHGLFQFGRNTSGHIAQNGNGGTGATFQFGW
jgi:minor curlin subunit